VHGTGSRPKIVVSTNGRGVAGHAGATRTKIVGRDRLAAGRKNLVADLNRSPSRSVPHHVEQTVYGGLGDRCAAYRRRCWLATEM
jgi:hypothetical protein